MTTTATKHAFECNCGCDPCKVADCENYTTNASGYCDECQADRPCEDYATGCGCARCCNYRQANAEYDPRKEPE